MPRQQGEQIGRVCHLFRKYSHSVKDLSISNMTLFLRPLILNFLYSIVTSLLPHGAGPFQKRSTNRVCSSKRIVFMAWRLRFSDSSINMKLFRETMVICGRVSIIFVLLSVAKDKNYFSNFNGYRIRGTLFYITPHSSF